MKDGPVPGLNGIVETALYVEDVNRSIRFYTDLFRMTVLYAEEEFCALGAGGKDVLLFFHKGYALKPSVMPGGVIPPHDAAGAQHIGFSINRSELPAWEMRLNEHNVAIESRVSWPLGGESLYFRDPDNHLLELLTPGVWTVY
ncbi:MAG: VOC family protein [Bryobacteraceae bacterium]